MCNGPLTSSGSSMKAAIVVLVLQFCVVFGSVVMDPNDDEEQEKIKPMDGQNPLGMAFKIIVYMLISIPAIILFYALVAGELMTNYFSEDSYGSFNTCSKDDIWKKYTDDDDTVHHLTLKG